MERRGTEMLKTATHPLSPISRISEREDQEGRFYDLASIAYLGSKTVQPMGGSSESYDYKEEMVVPTGLEPVLPT